MTRSIYFWSLPFTLKLFCGKFPGKLPGKLPGSSRAAVIMKTPQKHEKQNGKPENVIWQIGKSADPPGRACRTSCLPTYPPYLLVFLFPFVFFSFLPNLLSPRGEVYPPTQGITGRPSARPRDRTSERPLAPCGGRGGGPGDHVQNGAQWAATLLTSLNLQAKKEEALVVFLSILEASDGPLKMFRFRSKPPDPSEMGAQPLPACDSLCRGVNLPSWGLEVRKKGRKEERKKES